LIVVFWSASSSAALAQAGKCIAVHGALLMPTTGAKWDSLAANANVPADRLIVALFGGEFRSANDAVDAKVVADVGMRGPFPVLEAAVRFHANAKADLAITLDRGILVLTNVKKSGAAHVQLRIGDETFEIALSEPKSKVGIEIYGRHAPGPPHLKSPKDDAPVLNAAFFVVEGEVVIGNEQQATRLHAPPGPALFMWDNLTRMPEVNRMETLPDSVKPLTPEEKKVLEKISGFAKGWAAKSEPLTKTLRAAVNSADPMERKAAVVALGAVDDLPGLFAVLSNKNHADARDMAVLAIRHWLGRGPGKSIELNVYLTKAADYTPTQAKNLIHLFYGVTKERLRHPETYELLIEALNHTKMPARELARWHLVRLVPEGASIKYDAAAPEAERLQAIAEWRRLVPPGELPPPPKKKAPR
jgi:hypothetical protein